ncbi:hypothetical protein TNCV_1370741 [Trichonephila clavipes]|nr:hypothetical protein TNCV_1370741 [Trichonephila clavipes]
MCDTLRRLAVTNIMFITVQQGYEFRNDVYVDRRSFHWTSLYSGLLICHFRFHYGRSTRLLPVRNRSCATEQRH